MEICKLSRKLRSDLEPSYLFRGFYRHPELRDVFANALGVCVSKRKVIPLPVTFLKSGYYGIRGCRGRTHLHTVIAETFLDRYNVKDEVNHRDGVKTNPSVVNLEWVSRSKNVTHAFENGLRDENIEVDVRNLETGEVVACRSIIEAAKVVGINQHTVSSYLMRGLHRQYTLKDVYEIKLKCEDWILTKNSIGKNSGPGNKGVVVRRMGTSQYFLFSSAPAAGEYIGLKPHLLYSHLSGGTVDLKNHGYEAWYMVDIDVPITEMVDLRKPRPAPLVPRRVAPMVRVYDKLNETTTIYNSLQEFCTLIGKKKETVGKAVSIKGEYKHYVIAYI